MQADGLSHTEKANVTSRMVTERAATHLQQTVAHRHCADQAGARPYALVCVRDGRYSSPAWDSVYVYVTRSQCRMYVHMLCASMSMAHAHVMRQLSKELRILSMSCAQCLYSSHSSVSVSVSQKLVTHIAPFRIVALLVAKRSALKTLLVPRLV